MELGPQRTANVALRHLGDEDRRPVRTTRREISSANGTSYRNSRDADFGHRVAVRNVRDRELTVVVAEGDDHRVTQYVSTKASAAFA